MVVDRGCTMRRHFILDGHGAAREALELAAGLAERADARLAPVSGAALRRVALLARLAQWRLSWGRYDPDYVPEGLGPMFVSARRAAELVDDGVTGLSCGIAAFHPSSILYWAIRDRFRASGHPRGLTWCAVAGAGGRGRVPGMLEELGERGLVTRAILGHAETVRSFLALAAAGDLELHTLPQGELAFLIEAQGDGVYTLTTEVGVGTFLDPRVGPGSAVTSGAPSQLVTVDGERLRYELPRLDLHIFNAPYADRDGNIYIRGAACLTEIHDGTRAVHANSGTVIACVADVIDPDPPSVYVPAEWVDAIVVNPANEQLAPVPQRHHWPMFVPGAGVSETSAQADVRFVNRLLGLTPRRSAADRALARAGAAVAARELRPGDIVNVGTGLPEEVGRLLYENLPDNLVLTTEAGVVGGAPTSGLFFGAAINPTELVSSAEIFHRYAERLGLACVGILEVDSRGNVNVSRRGAAVTDEIGPGGFPDITHHARTVVFVGSFALGELLELSGARLLVREQGRPKFVNAVREVTFNAEQALRRGQRVFYVTHRGVLRLRGDGLELTHVMPGIDIERDIRSAPARIMLPEGGIDAVQTLGPDIVTGVGYSPRIRAIRTSGDRPERTASRSVQRPR